MKRLFTLSCLLLSFLAGISQNSNVVNQVVVSEYRAWFITQDGKIWAYGNTGVVPVQYPIGGLKAVTGAGGFNYFRIIDEQGYVWTSNIDLTKNAARIDKDATGAPFNGNTYVDAYGHVAMTIRTDGSVWYFGQDIFSLFYPGGSTLNMTGVTMAPTQISPAGWKFKKVLFAADGVLGLTTSGQVYKWNYGKRTPVLMSTPRPAIDIFTSHLPAYGCIVPDDGAAQTSGYPYIWGSVCSMWGGKQNYTKPTSVKDLWKMTAPIKEISMDWNTIHYIDVNGNMFGGGFNSFGEVGNGQEFLNKYNYPGFPGYGWDFKDYENPSGIPVQIGQGVKWKHVYSNNWFGFYKYAMDESNNLYSWGRNKTSVLGNGFWNGYNGGEFHPNQMDVLKPTLVHPLTAILTEYGFIPPSISVSPKQTIAAASVTLTGTAKAPLAIAVRRPAPNGIDTAGYHIVSYKWTQVSGPPNATITSPNAATTTVTGLKKGTYVFNLLTTDDNTGTLSANATVEVTKDNGNDQVTANAGQNQSITLPANSVTLAGSGQSTGSIASYKWTQVSGPSNASIASSNQAQTAINGLIQGVYKFQLQVTTLLGTIGLATVQVTVNAPVVVPGPPVVNAGVDKTITLPANSATLTGTASESNGTITAYKWTQVSGPSTASLATPTQVQATAGKLIAGTYVFRLTVTDAKGVTAYDQVNINVMPGSTAATPPPPPPGYQNIPGTIQAESYSAMNGIINEATTDEGGGRDASALQKNNQLSYNIDAARSGVYEAKFRLATVFSGASFTVEDASGHIFATVSVPYTGGGQTWTTLTTRLNIPAGRQTLKLVSQTIYGWNLNWMQFSFVTDATVSTIPGMIQAEEYDNMSGVSLETTQDTGGGEDAGFDGKDMMSYRVNVTASGAYTVGFRVATPYNSIFKLLDGNNRTLATINVPGTGGWQVWKTINTTVTLAAGQQQTLVLVAQNSNPCNINWMQFSKQTATAVNRQATASGGSILDVSDSAMVSQPPHFTVYPNPVIDQVTLEIANEHTGRVDVQVINNSGSVVRSYVLNKDVPVMQAPLMLGNLAPGVYVIRAIGTGWSSTGKILKK